MASGFMDRLRNEVLNLSDSERAELACDLVRSLDGPPDIEAAKKWDAEILRRLDEITSRSAQTADRAEFAQRMRGRISRL